MLSHLKIYFNPSLYKSIYPITFYLDKEQEKCVCFSGASAMIEEYKKFKYTIQTLNSTVDRNCIQAVTSSNDLVKGRYDQCLDALRCKYYAILQFNDDILTLQTARRRRTLPWVWSMLVRPGQPEEWWSVTTEPSSRTWRTRRSSTRRTWTTLTTTTKICKAHTRQSAAVA